MFTNSIDSVIECKTGRYSPIFEIVLLTRKKKNCKKLYIEDGKKNVKLKFFPKD